MDETAVVNELSETIVDVSPLIDSGVDLVVVVLVVLGGIAVKLVAKWLKLQEDDRMLLLLEDAIQSGISLAANKLKEEGKDRLGEVTVKNQIIGIAADYVIKTVPTVVKSMKLEDKLAELVEAKLVERLDIETTHMVEDLTGKTELVDEPPKE